MLITKDVLSTIILTSNYAVLRNILDQARPFITRETATAVGVSLKELRSDLDFEIRYASKQVTGIPKDGDPILLTATVEDKLHTSLTGWMEDGFNDPHIIHSGDQAIMNNVGYIRKLHGRITRASEMFEYKDTVEGILGLADQAREDEDTFIGYLEIVNSLIIALSILDPGIRLRMVTGVIEGF